MPWRTAFFVETLVARIRIGYFLEDRAHENFLKALVRRIAEEEGFPESDLAHDVRSGWGGKTIPEFEQFLKEYRSGHAVPFDMLVVAVDGNCRGYNERAKDLRQSAERAQFPALDRIVFAIPDPHIERWYLIDAEAVRKALNTSRGPDIPAYKCEKGYYKSVLRETVRSAGIESLLGGVE